MMITVRMITLLDDYIDDYLNPQSRNYIEQVSHPKSVILLTLLAFLLSSLRRLHGVTTTASSSHDVPAGIGLMHSTERADRDLLLSGHQS